MPNIYIPQDPRIKPEPGEFELSGFPDWMINGLVGWWIFNEGAGITVFDAIYGNNGTLTNMDPVTDWVSGQFGGSALKFGGADERALVGDKDALKITDGITMSAWVFDDATAVTGRVMGKVESQFKYSLRVNNVNQSLDVEIYTTSLSLAQWPGGPGGLNFMHNKWTHIVGTYDRSDIKLYVNGNLKASTAKTGDIRDDTSPFSIGSWGGPAHFLNTVVDDVRVYNCALTAAEVMQLYERPFERKPRIFSFGGNGETFNESVTDAEDMFDSISLGLSLSPSILDVEKLFDLTSPDLNLFASISDTENLFDSTLVDLIVKGQPVDILDIVDSVLPDLSLLPSILDVLNTFDLSLGGVTISFLVSDTLDGVDSVLLNLTIKGQPSDILDLFDSGQVDIQASVSSLDIILVFDIASPGVVYGELLTDIDIVRDFVHLLDPPESPQVIIDILAGGYIRAPLGDISIVRDLSSVDLIFNTSITEISIIVETLQGQIVASLTTADISELFDSSASTAAIARVIELALLSAKKVYGLDVDAKASYDLSISAKGRYGIKVEVKLK